MTDAYLCEIRPFTGKKAPAGWAFCDGQLLPIVNNTALYAILRNTYGGDGRTTFALPDLRGRVPVGAGAASGHPARNLGQPYGSEAVALREDQLPAHRHPMVASPTPGNSRNPLQPSGQSVNLARSADGFAYKAPAENLLPMNGAAIGPSGSGQPHQNMQPYLTLGFIICLQGTWPPHLDHPTAPSE